MKKYLLVSIVTAGVIFSVQATSQNVKLSPIKPAKNAVLTDEQQAIQAVRSAKTSVVNIVGNKVKEVEKDTVLSVNTVSGTGIVISSDGYIVSNSHVVIDSANSYNVVFADGRILPARVVGLDKFNDVALIKVEAAGLPVAKLGDSGSLETGQSVFAIGNSLGKYQNTVTRGVVSGLGRAVDVSDINTIKPRLQNLIQTDAAISVGNSGGPLVNLLGEVVGMNTLMEREASNVGFAVPINTVKQSAEELKKFGKVSRPYLGIVYQTLTPALQLLKKQLVEEGALVLEVVKDLPAAKAGLKAGDVIVEINREKLNQKTELDLTIVKYQAGTQLLIKVARGKEFFEMPLILGEYK